MRQFATIDTALPMGQFSTLRKLMREHSRHGVQARAHPTKAPTKGRLRNFASHFIVATRAEGYGKVLSWLWQRAQSIFN